jgi:hypothetical protein
MRGREVMRVQRDLSARDSLAGGGCSWQGPAPRRGLRRAAVARLRPLQGVNIHNMGVKRCRMRCLDGKSTQAGFSDAVGGEF